MRIETANLLRIIGYQDGGSLIRFELNEIRGIIEKRQKSVHGGME
jgi:hypothetical protein